ncbi:hypothetical protein AAFF_G00239160 [Aldrovandia affinis]|uniref:Uncharacterized protein n=1 Tax=Aldrovandia affinis TaxID=143900 RepID=A0AAD7W3Z5_9TELE|nr:hypothetical protein AAFF_G00239160 [Aldrovandia affinis]
MRNSAPVLKCDTTSGTDRFSKETVTLQNQNRSGSGSGRRLLVTGKERVKQEEYLDKEEEVEKEASLDGEMKSRQYSDGNETLSKGVTEEASSQGQRTKMLPVRLPTWTGSEKQAIQKGPRVSDDVSEEKSLDFFQKRRDVTRGSGIRDWLDGLRKPSLDVAVSECQPRPGDSEQCGSVCGHY